MKDFIKNNFKFMFCVCLILFLHFEMKNTLWMHFDALDRFNEMDRKRISWEIGFEGEWTRKEIERCYKVNTIFELAAHENTTTEIKKAIEKASL